MAKNEPISIQSLASCCKTTMMVIYMCSPGTFCKPSFSRLFKPIPIPILEVMELYGDEAGKQRPGDATRYGPFYGAPNEYVNVFHGAVRGKITKY